MPQEGEAIFRYSVGEILAMQLAKLTFKPDLLETVRTKAIGGAKSLRPLRGKPAAPNRIRKIPSRGNLPNAPD